MITHNGTVNFAGNGQAFSRSYGFDAAESLVAGRTSDGTELHGTLLRLAPQAVTFETYNSQSPLRLSEVLQDFKIVVDHHVLYVGTAVVNSIVNTGTASVCDVLLRGTLEETDLFRGGSPREVLPGRFKEFLDRWQHFYRVLPEYKLAVADMQSFFQELRIWLEQVELGLRSYSPVDRQRLEREVVQQLTEASAPAIDSMFERFESVTRAVPVDLIAAHCTFCHRQLHPIILCSPFMHRIYTKPLGYAGDYEMVNMILRDPFEGPSLFAKILNVYILGQVPAQAHRNRVEYLLQKLVQETRRVTAQSRPCRIQNLGCGPAGEVQRFLSDSHLSDQADFTLVDMNEETLEYTRGILEGLKTKYQRHTAIRPVRKSVQQLLKQNGRPKASGEEFDFVYSAGLFDYLSDRVCKTILTMTYDQLAPGGLLLVTNVEPGNPIRNIMDHIYDWHLIHRTHGQLLALAADLPHEALVAVQAEPTSSNILLEIRKPAANA